jgi:hypothetical protein
MDIRDQLVREISDSDAPPIGSLVADAVTSGIRARRRRNGLLGGAAAGLAVVAVAAAVNMLSGTAPVSPAQAGTLPGLIAASAAAPSPTPAKIKPSPDPTDTAKYAPGKPVVKLLEHLVAPHGHFTEVSYSSGSFLYNDGHGAATISALVSDTALSYGSDVKGMACPAIVPDFTCVVRHLPNGVVARIMTMGPYHSDCNEPKCSVEDRRVEIERTDGLHVAVDAYSGPQGQGRAATRTGTILSTSQLIAIATNPQWQLNMS